MTQNDLIFTALIALTAFGAVSLAILGAWPMADRVLRREETRLDTVLNKELLLGVPPRAAMALCGTLIFLVGLFMGLLTEHPLGFAVGVLFALSGPYVAVQKL
ncbi:MAG: hypothetical protein ACYTGQ_00705, partial [Planctomycetota bacterium]